MTATSETFKASWIASLQSHPEVTSLVASGEIREWEYQSTEWTYPAVRIALDFKPSVNGCGPDDADLEIYCYSAQKSSKESVHLASVIQQLYHKKNFTKLGVRFSTIVVREVVRPMRSIYAWETCVKIFCQGI